MRNSLVVLLLFFAADVAPALWAQNELSRLEVYGGYDYIRFNINANVTGQPPSQTFNGNGSSGQLVFNANNWLGILGDAGGSLGHELHARWRGDPFACWAAGKLPARRDYTVCSSFD